MAKVKITGHASGTGVLTVTAPNTSTDRTITLPDSTDTLAVNGDVTNKLPLAGGTMTGTLNVSESGNNAEIKVGTQTANAHQGYSGVQFEDRGYIGGYPNDSLGIFYNTYHSSGSKAIETATACNMQLLNEGVRFQVAPSVSADAAQTFTNVLTLKTDGRGLSNFTAKVWVRFNGQSTPSIQGSHNVSSITDNGTGQYTVNFSNNMTGTNYTVATTCENYSWDTVVKVSQPSDVLVGSCKLLSVRVANNSYEDSRLMCLAIFGGE